MLICFLIISGLYTFQNFRSFSFERKAAPIYAILVRSVLHIYAVGLYNYTFHPFSVTSPSVRVHILYCPSAQPIAECLKKLRRPCAHGWQHVCTHPSHLLSSGLRTLHIYTKIVFFAGFGKLPGRQFYECKIYYFCVWGILHSSVPSFETRMDGQNYVLQHISLNSLFFSSLFPVKSVIFVASIIPIVNAEVQK